MAEWCAERSCDEALAELEKASIVAGQVYSPQQALDDAHIRAAHLLEGTTPADIMRVVRDARRLARMAERPLRLADLETVLAPQDVDVREDILLERARGADGTLTGRPCGRCAGPESHD